MILVSLILTMHVFAVYADDGSTVMMTNNAANPGYPGYGSGPGSMDSLAMYQQFYEQDQGALGSGQVLSGPAQFDLNGNEPAYLIINGQSQPYNPYYVPANSFWIQGSSAWTQYIMCPLNARFAMLAFSQGGPMTVVETYSDGYQSVQQYVFYPGYTRLIFVADAVGRHTLTFYAGNQPSNPVYVDVTAYGGAYVSGNVPQAGQPYSGQILIDSQYGGFDPTAEPAGYSDPYAEPGTILIDSASEGFDPLAPVKGEAI